MSTDARFVNCPGCHADISDDREFCPHCKTPVVPALEVEAQKSNDENTNRLTQEIVRLERSHNNALEQVLALTKENAELRAENAELHKRQGA